MRRLLAWFALLILITAVEYTFPQSIDAWPNTATHGHVDITQKAIEYLEQSEGIDFDAQLNGHSIAYWVKKGAQEEDPDLWPEVIIPVVFDPELADPRYICHFYPAIAPSGLYYATPDTGPTVDSVEWGIDDHPLNEYGWPDAITNANTYLGWIALGHVVHLLEDLAVPAHTRTDYHVLRKPIENYASEHFLDSCDSLDNINLENIDQSPTEMFLELQQYTQSNFFSNDTCFSPFYPGPSAASDDADYFYDLDDHKHKIAHKGILYWAMFKAFGSEAVAKPFCKIDQAIAEYQYCVLAPKAASWAATLIKYYYEARNGKIAFVSERDGNEEIYVMNPDGSEQTNLTNHTSFDCYPAWSPDGTKIAFTSNRDGDIDIYVMNPDGTDITRLTNDPFYDHVPAWSPDGSRIAFVSDRDGAFKIYVMNSDGTEITTLLSDVVEFEGRCAWSPDGGKIAFSSDRDGNSEIYVVKSDGSDPENLTNTPDDDEYLPAWSPDGTKIAFQSEPGGGPLDDIYVMASDGSNRQQLTNMGHAKCATWSPDGGKIAFSWDTDDQIYVMNADGSNQENVSNSPGPDYAPAWSPRVMAP